MKEWNRTQIMKGLQELVPEIDFLKKSEEYETKKGGIGATGIPASTKKTVEYSYEQLRQMYANTSSIYSLIMIMNQILMVGTCIHFLEIKLS
ncbi:MAG: hypothetical protein ISR79_01855 [Nitrosopumilus sp.]|nr:hypothetical protein [Nitrosopumilus sp.]